MPGARMTCTCKTTPHALQERALVKSKYALSAMNMFRACMDREVLLVKRNLFLYGFRTVQTIIIGVCVVLTFFHSRMPANTQADGGKFFSVLFFSLLIIMFDGVALLSVPVSFMAEDVPGGVCTALCFCGSLW